MKPHEQILLENKDFITAAALHRSSPDRSNVTAKAILAAYNSIDPTVEALAECATCGNPYETPFRIIYAYCNGANWFVNSDSELMESMRGAVNALNDFGKERKNKK